MSKPRANSSPDLLPFSDLDRHADDSSIHEGATAKVRLLLKLVQDYEDATRNGGSSTPPGKPSHNIAGILCVLDDVKSGLERSHVLACRRESRLRRCNTDLRRGSTAGAVACPVVTTPHSRDQRVPPGTAVEENQRLRKELSASMAARKSLEKMFSSLGKEKEIMAAELQRKAHELHDMEEHLSDLKAQNEKLLEKAQVCAAEHKEIKNTNKTSDGDRGSAAAAAVAACEKVLHDRNKVLSEQLLKALDGYRSLKRKLKEAQEEKVGVQARVAEMAGQVAAGMERIREICRGIVGGKGDAAAGAAARGGAVEEEISSIERMFRGLHDTVSSAMAGVGKGK